MLINNENENFSLHNHFVSIINKASSARSANDEALVVQTDSEVGIYYGDCIEKKLACVRSQLPGTDPLSRIEGMLKA